MQRNDEQDRWHLSLPSSYGCKVKEAVLAALDSDWVAPAGPQLDLFEMELGKFFPMESVYPLAQALPKKNKVD